MEVFPYKIHTVLTNAGMAFADLPQNREGPGRRFLGPHTFDRVYMAHVNRASVDQLTIRGPWATNGRAERMKRIL